jgi:hypothetical protein
MVLGLSDLVLLMIGRVVNVLIPRQLGIVTDELAGEGGNPRIFSSDLSDCSENAMGQFTGLRFSTFHAGKYGFSRCNPFIRLDSHRTGISN